MHIQYRYMQVALQGVEISPVSASQESGTIIAEADGNSFMDLDKLSIIVPVFNEAPNILPLAREVHAAMSSSGQSYELLFVDDASTDDTALQVAEAQRTFSEVRGLRLQQRTGQSGALWTGIHATTSPVVATLDGDLQNDPRDLPRLLRELKDCDFVCGVRCKRCDSWVRRVSTRVARWARRKVLKVDFTDTGCAVRVFRRSVLDGLFAFDGLHRFLPVLVHANGARTKQLPICHRPRTAGCSKYGVWNRLGRGIYDLIAVCWWLKRRIGRVTATELRPA